MLGFSFRVRTDLINKVTLHKTDQIQNVWWVSTIYQSHNNSTPRILIQQIPK